MGADLTVGLSLQDSDDWLSILDWVTEGCSKEEKRKLFHDNGKRIYRLG